MGYCCLAIFSDLKMEQSIEITGWCSLGLPAQGQAQEFVTGGHLLSPPVSCRRMLLLRDAARTARDCCPPAASESVSCPASSAAPWWQCFPQREVDLFSSTNASTGAGEFQKLNKKKKKIIASLQFSYSLIFSNYTYEWQGVTEVPRG